MLWQAQPAFAYPLGFGIPHTLALMVSVAGARPHLPETRGSYYASTYVGGFADLGG